MRKLNLILLCLLAFIKVDAQLTGLDTSFNHNGVAVHNGADRHNAWYQLLPNDFTVQPDGSVITVTSVYGRYSAYFVRFRENGSIDSSFHLWQQSIYLYGLDDKQMRLLSLSDGRFMFLAKTSDDSAVLWRFMPNGALDGSFGQRKYHLKHQYYTNLPEYIAVQPDGKIIMCMNSQGIPTLLRIEANGKIDSTFGAYGYVTLNGIAGQGYKVNKILFTGSRILCAGANAMPSYDKFGVQAFKYNGEPDSSFGTNGIKVVDMGWGAVIKGCGLQRNGKIILGGVMGGGYSNNIGVLRLHANGIVDSSFGTNGDGIEITDLNNSWDEVGGVNVDDNDVIWATAAKYNPNNASLPLYEPMLVRYTKNGKVDSLYKTNGRIPFTLTTDHISYMRTTIVKDKLHIFGNGYWGGNRCEYVARLFLRPVLNISGPASYCDYDTALIIGKSSLPHKWYRNDTLLSHTGDTIKTRTPGTYMLVLTEGAASDSSAKVAVSFKPPISKAMLVGTSTPICEGDTILLLAYTPTPGVQWNLVTPNDTFTNTSDYVHFDSVTVADAGWYIMTAELDGCFSEPDSLQVAVHPVVVPSVTATADKPNPGPWVNVLFSATPVNGGSTPTYQWTKNGTNIPGANAITYTATTATDIKTGDVICVKLTNNGICARPATVSDCKTVNIDLAVDDVPVTEQLIIYPNPSDGRITLKAEHKGTWYLSNIQGQVLMTFTVSAGVNDIMIPASVPNGTYILQMLHDGKKATAQLVIER